MATLTVTTLDDEASGGGDLATETSDGTGLSLREALALAQDGDTITFDNALSGMTSTLSGTQLTITQDDLTIDGDLDDDGTADITIDANDQSRVFELAAGVSEANQRDLTIDGMVITGGYHVLRGAGIYLGSDTNTVITSSTITENAVADGSNGYGGGIFIYENTSLEISGSVISNNFAPTGGGISDAALALGNSEIYIIDSEISSNVTGYGSGGGIFNGSAGQLTIIGSTLDGNYAERGGGGVAKGNGFGSGGLDIINSTISNNTSRAFGGGVYSSANTGSIVNTTITDNTSIYSLGGGLHLSGDVDLLSATITGNSARSNGGGLYVSSGNTDLANTIIAGNYSRFFNDDLSSSGGATITYTGTNIFSTAGLGDAEDIIETDISNIFDQVSNEGGFDQGVLSDNGGAVETVLIRQGGTADGTGDASALPADFADIDGDINTAEDLPLDARGFERVRGGALDVGAVEIQSITVTTNLDTGDDATVTGDLAAETADGDGLSLREALALAQDGETITFDAGMTITLGGTQLTITQDGLTIDGDLDNDGTADVTIDANDASRVLELNAGTAGDPRQFNLDGIIITEGNITGSEGAGLFLGNDTQTTVSNSVISNNTNNDGEGNENGGGIYLGAGTEASLYIYGSTISGNYAHTSGGGIFAVANSRLFITDSVIDGNSSNGSGAGVRITGAGSYLSMDTTTISNNYTIGATGGGGVFSGADATYVSDSVFDSNYAGNKGGGLELASATGVGFVTNTVFTNNSAGLRGGALYIQSQDATIVGASFLGNSAIGNGGGAIYNQNGDLGVANSLFAGNTAAGDGGAIQTNGNLGSFSGVNSTFYGNSSAGQGGAFSINQSSGNLFNSTLTGNYAALGGGGIALSGVYGDYGSLLIHGILSASNGAGVGEAEIESGPYGSTNGSVYNVFNKAGLFGPSSSDSQFLALSVFNETIINPYTGLTSGRLRDNGGPVETIMTRLGSAATNIGPDMVLTHDEFDLDGDLTTNDALPFDGRGDARIANGRLDYGAVELQVTDGTSGNNAIDGDAFSEIINGGAGNDTLRGLSGRDTINGDAGKDLIFGNNGEDFIRGGTENDDLRGSLGDDTLYGDNGRDFLRGNGGDDDLRGGAGGDTLDGGLDNDQLRGASGDDTLNGRIGDDLLSAGIDDDLLRAHEGNDTLVGGDGDDTLFGNPGDDIMNGGNGNDDLRGGNEDDTLSGDDGNDTLRGNTGDDQFNFALGDDADQIIGFVAGAATDDVIAISGFGTAFDEFAEVQAVASDDGNGNTVIDFGGGDTITLNGVSAASLHEDDFVFV